MAKKKTPVEPPAKQDGLNAKVRGIEVRLSSVVKYLEKTFLADVDGDGNVAGHLRVMIAAALLIGVSIIGITHAATVWNLRDSADAYNVIAVGDDGAFVVQSADGTETIDVAADGTVTAGAGGFAGAVAGDPTCDDINMSGAVGDSLGFNITQAGTVTGLTATVKLVDASGVPTDTDYVVQKLFVMDNDNTQEVSWCEVRTVIDDATIRLRTEPSNCGLWLMVH